MIIDAMDLLYSDRIDAFELVSSDSDFTKLASRLRESEKFVFGVGEKKTPVSFRNACDDFVFTEKLDTGQDAKPEKVVAGPSPVSSSNGAEELIPAFLKAWELCQNEDG
nr:NYN domain-containing protein [Alteromonas sp. RKMC-009]